MKETRYVLCDCCEKKIYLGSEIYCLEGYCGVYCSAKCYADSYATIKIMDEDEAENCSCRIFDDAALEKEKEELKKEIYRLQNALDKLDRIGKE